MKLATPLAEMTEKEWSRSVYELAEMLGWHRYHTFLPKYSAAGYPDETLVRERVVFLELKTEKGKLSPAQREWLGWLRDTGAEVYVARPRHLDALAIVLSQRRKRAGDDWDTDLPGSSSARGQLLLELDSAIGTRSKEAA